MQGGHLKLKEIIYEITGACNNGCSYCGSKENWGAPIDSERIRKIVDEIAKYPPEQLDVSGGDPLLVPFADHKYLVNKLGKSTCCKILVNPKSIKQSNEIGFNSLDPNIVKILNLYEVIGISVNTSEELDLLFKINFYEIKPKIVFITNFNLSNYFLFDLISGYVLQNGHWMIQFTMYKENQDQLALYKNENAHIEFNNKVNTLFPKYADKIFLSDNLNEVPCSAGRNSIGLLHDGGVVPCLSMRSWEDKLIPEENILKMELQTIWETKFVKNRFGEFKCCKDHCNNKKIQIVPRNIIDDILGTKGNSAITSRIPYQVIAYAVISPDRYDNQTYVYACPDVRMWDKDSPTITTSTATTSFTDFEDEDK